MLPLRMGWQSGITAFLGFGKMHIRLRGQCYYLCTIGWHIMRRGSNSSPLGVSINHDNKRVYRAFLVLHPAAFNSTGDLDTCSFLSMSLRISLLLSGTAKRAMSFFPIRRAGQCNPERFGLTQVSGAAVRECFCPCMSSLASRRRVASVGVAQS